MNGVNIIDNIVDNRFWLIAAWGGVVTGYLLFAMTYVGRRTGTNFFLVWWRTGTSNIKTERTFAIEVQEFPVLKLIYIILKWGTPVVVAAGVVLALLHTIN